MIGYKGIIFDFNGVLWSDTEIQHRAWIEFSKKIRGTPFSVDEMSLHVHGRPNKYTMEYLLGRGVSKEELPNLVQGKESIYRSMCLKRGKNFRLSPGSKRLLDFIAKKKIPHTIATASEITNLQFFFRHLGLSRWFDINQVVYDDGRLPGKPAPDIYLKAAALIGLAPGECIVVEDSISGLRSAYSAGIGMIIGFGPKEKHSKLLREKGVGMTICSFKEFDYRLLK